MRAEDNELLTRVGPGTPMGEFMRQYWFPALKSEELEAGGAPVRLRLLGENFIAFRGPDGDAGILDHRCPHRCASLFYGRNEAGGIRCVYHGWKFDTTGQCVDQPSEPPETQFKDKVRLKAAAVTERHGVVWAYIGPRREPPPFPEFDIDRIPAAERTVNFTFRECNWLQALEGDIDTCHVGFLHMGAASPEKFAEGSVDYYRARTLAPKYEAIETPYGTMYSAYRPAGEGETYHRIGQFLFPSCVMTPPDPLGTISWRSWVPVDDEHVMAVAIHGRRPSVEKARPEGQGGTVAGAVVKYDYLPNTADWYGRWRLKQNRRNDYMISRERQRHDNYTGIEGIFLQDQAITESMGPIQDRTHERLGTSDKMITLTRRALIGRVRAFEEDGAVPPGVETPEIFRGVRSGYVVLPEEADWLTAFKEYRTEWGAPIQPVITREKTIETAGS